MAWPPLAAGAPPALAQPQQQSAMAGSGAAGRAPQAGWAPTGGPALAARGGSMPGHPTSFLLASDLMAQPAASAGALLGWSAAAPGAGTQQPFGGHLASLELQQQGGRQQSPGSHPPTLLSQPVRAGPAGSSASLPVPGMPAAGTAGGPAAAARVAGGAGLEGGASALLSTISVKLFGCTPAELPPTLRQQLE